MPEYEIPILTNDDKNELLSLTPYVLPDNPSDKGFSANQIRKKMYQGYVWIFEKMNELADATADYFGAIGSGDVVAKKAEKDADGHTFSTYYATNSNLMALQLAAVTLGDAQTITGKKTFSGGASFTSGNVNFGSSGSDNSKQLDIYYATNLRGPVTSNTIIPGNTFSLGSAEHYWGSAYIDDLFLYGVISDGMYEWAFPSKNGTIVLDSDITKSALETTLGAASSSSNGYMSSSDKSHLDALYALLGSESDADSVVDTINEVLSVFNQYPEGVELSLVLAGKVGYSDIYDALDSTATNKALSANQGKALNDRLTTAEGTISNHGTRLTTAEGDIDDLEADKADKTGYYGTMGAGFADVAKELETSIGIEQETPISFNTVGGDSDVSTGEHRLDALTGVSVVDNQLADFTVDLTTKSVNGITIETDLTKKTIRYHGTSSAFAGCGGITSANSKENLIVGHIYYVKLLYAGTIPSGVAFSFSSFDKRYGDFIATATSTSQYMQTQINSATTVDFTISYKIYDLTQRYGNNTVVNAIIGNSNQVANLLRFDPNILKLTSYDAGTLTSSKTKELLSVGRNAFDGELEVGWINFNGVEDSSTNTFRSKHYIRVASGQTYILSSALTGYTNMYVYEYDINKNLIKYSGSLAPTYIPSYELTLQPNTCYLRFAYYKNGADFTNNLPSTEVNQICLYPKWDGSRIGYEPYETHSYQLPNLVQRGILKVDASGNVYADGDVAYPDGTGETRFAEFDLTDLPDNHIAYNNTAKAWNVLVPSSTGAAKATGSNDTLNVITNYYEATTRSLGYGYDNAGKIYSNAEGTLLYINNGSTTTKPTGKVIYELATPTPITFDPFTPNIFGDDFGTFQALDEDGNEANLQGFNIFYRANIAGFAESIYVNTDGKPAKVVLSGYNEIDPQIHYLKDTDDRVSAVKEALGGTLRQVLAVKESLDFADTAYVDLGDCTWTYDTSGANPMFTTEAISNVIEPPSGGGVVAKTISTLYKTVDNGTLFGTSGLNLITSVNNYGNLRVVNTSYTDPTAFKAAMKGVLLAYKKA